MIIPLRRLAALLVATQALTALGAAQSGAGEHLGTRLRPAGDLDADGRDDLLAEVQRGDSTLARGITSVDGSTLLETQPPWLIPPFISGYETIAFAGAADIDGDGRAEVLHSNGSYYYAALTSPRVLPLHSATAAIWPWFIDHQIMELDAGTAHAGDLYLLLGSLSGSSPGLDVGPVHLPLNLDDYLLHTLNQPNQAPLSASLGTLDDQGRAGATFTVKSVPPALGWRVVRHAFVVLDPVHGVVFTSNALPVMLMP